MKRRLIYILSGIALIAGTSCTENIDIDFKTTEERLVVDAKLTDEAKVHEVLVMKINLNPEDSIVSGITGATVTLNDGDTTYTLAESNERAGLYLTEPDFKAVTGKTYTLRITDVEINGKNANDVYTAKATMPKALHIDSVRAEYYKPWKAWQLKCWAVDPVETNYYLFKAWRNGVCVSDSIFEFQFTDDAMYNGNKINGVMCQYYQDEFKDEYIVDNDTVELEIDNIDKNYYRHLTELQSEYWGTNPMFGGPPANVYSNFDNDAIGYFAVYSVSKSSYVVKNASRN